jgi:hypothetical protein
MIVMDPWQSILLAFGGNAALLVLLGWLARSLGSQLLARDIEKFKRNIELTAQREIETYKAQLEKDRLRLQISYGGIFEKQADAILDLYKIVLTLERAASDAVNNLSEPAPERQLAFRQAWSAIRTSYQQSRILLPQDIDEMLDNFINRMFRGVFEYMRMEARDLRRVTDDEFQRLSDRQDAALEVIENELPALREKLILSMRRTMGVASSEL